MSSVSSLLTGALLVQSAVRQAGGRSRWSSRRTWPGSRARSRKAHVSVQPPDTDSYLGSTVIVAEPPNDPNVSMTLFSTKEVFDRRDAA